MCSEKLKEWLKMFEKIENALFDLRADQVIFRGFIEIVESNPALPENNLFIVWAWRNYLFTAAMAARRQISSKYDDVSLVNLLTAIMTEPTILSRQRYVSFFRDTGFKDDSTYINQCFDQLVGKGKESLDRADVTEDIKSLENAAKTLREYANKTIAHAGKDAESIKTLPTIKDLDGPIALFERVFNKYYGLAKAGGIQFPKVAQVPWKKIFLKPWTLDKKNLV